MSNATKVALFKTGGTIPYDTVTVIEETHTQAGVKKKRFYQFARIGIGITAVIPEERIASLDRDDEPKGKLEGADQVGNEVEAVHPAGSPWPGGGLPMASGSAVYRSPVVDD